MPNYMLRLAFVGSNYSGWQIQPQVPTVQGVLKEVIERILREEVKLTGCCRTDAGVHAQDYVANFQSSKTVDEEKLLRALNSLLPKDIGIYEVREAPESFNARFSVKGKTYLYKIWNAVSRNPFLYPFSWHIPYDLDLSLLQSALETFKGKRDFSGFAKLEEDKNTLIDLKVELTLNSPLIEIRFTASHFLRFMVRRLVGTAVEVAKGRLPPSDLTKFFEGAKSPHTAPAHGLTLEKVYL